MDVELNTVSEEAERRHALLFQEILAAMNRVTGGSRAYVNINHTTELEIVGRYTHEGTEHEIIQTVNLNFASRKRGQP